MQLTATLYASESDAHSKALCKYLMERAVEGSSLRSHMGSLIISQVITARNNTIFPTKGEILILLL